MTPRTSITTTQTESSTVTQIEINVDIDEISCPIELEIFSDPVMVMPCGHFFEKSTANKLSNCGICREKISSHAEAPAFLKNIIGSLKDNPTTSFKTNISISELISPETQSLFFDPVMVMPCGHFLESSTVNGSVTIGKCPTCNTDIISKANAPALLKKALDTALDLHPHLHQEVYFDLDLFANVIEQNRLKTPLAEKFIRILQHSHDRLNTRATAGIQIGKSAVQLLGSTQQGRELLRKDEKIKGLISVDSLKLTVNNHTIAEWLTLVEAQSAIKKARKSNSKPTLSAARTQELSCRDQMATDEDREIQREIQNRRGQATSSPTLSSRLSSMSSFSRPTNNNAVQLRVISSTQDIMRTSVQLTESTVASLEIMQDEDYLRRFRNRENDGGMLLDNLSAQFARYQIPIGFINRLIALSEYNLNFIIDDSGSMASQTNMKVRDASPFMQEQCRRNGKSDNDCLTRWEEAENRMHIFIEILQYIPTHNMTVSFLNRSNKLEFKHSGQSLQQFAANAHETISHAFRSSPQGATPIYRALRDALSRHHTKTMHYLMTDGEPSDSHSSDIVNLLIGRQNSASSPITFIPITDEDNEIEWMREIDEITPHTAFIEDFDDFQPEISRNQGRIFPNTRGLWLMNQLVGANNSDLFDALDEGTLLTKTMMDNLMGYQLPESEYKRYFDNHPLRNRYASSYNQFLTASSPQYSMRR